MTVLLVARPGLLADLRQGNLLLDDHSGQDVLTQLLTVYMKPVGTGAALALDYIDCGGIGLAAAQVDRPVLALGGLQQPPFNELFGPR
jgi:hypothetical protein